MNLVCSVSDFWLCGLRSLVTVGLVDGLAERGTNPCLDMSLGNQHHNRIGIGHLAVLSQMVPALHHSIVVGVNNDDEERTRVCHVPPPTSEQLLGKLAEYPRDVSTVDRSARISREENWWCCVEAAFFQIRANQLLLQVVLAEQDCLRNTITHSPTPARSSPPPRARSARDRRRV